jgi:DNA-binding IclR family transcriptional regulator
MHDILKYLKTNGEKLDTEIAEAMDLTLAKARLQLAELSAQGEIMTCHTTRFEKGKKIEGVSCRLSGHIPKAAPGRKSKVQLKLP